MKGGLGAASIKENGLVVGALVVVNAFGDIVNPINGKILAGALDEERKQFANQNQFFHNQLSPGENLFLRNTTLGVVATNAKFVFERRFLPMVREQIEERVLLLTVDEFEELGARVRRGRLPEEIFPYLRHLIQHEGQLAFIFAGTHKMEALVGDYWSVLFNIAKYKKVSFLSHDETTRLITQPVQSYGMVYDDLAIDEMLRLTACHPYFTQLLCTILVNRCNDAHCSYVTIQDVRDAVEELLETGRAHLTFLWQTSDQEAMLTLAALPELRDQLDRVSAAAIADRLGEYQIRMKPGQITKTMEQLTARDIVREIPGTPVSYDFTALLYAHWLRRYKSLSKVVEEASVEPAAAMAEMSAEPSTVLEETSVEPAKE